MVSSILTLSLDTNAWSAEQRLATTEADNPFAILPCAFCGVRSGRWQMGCTNTVSLLPSSYAKPVPACPLCALVVHLERPRIDQEVALIWLPEMPQTDVNLMMRELHMALRQHCEDLHVGARLRNPMRFDPRMYYARVVLAERMAPAADRLGTESPGELADALLELSPAAFSRRADLLDGIRLLPLGRFYHDGQDVYPSIVDAWLINLKNSREHVRSDG